MAPRRTLFAWALFDWASQPFFTLVTTFVFAPYFVAHVVADEARGQALWGAAVAVAGLTIALLAPVLGAVADHWGPRKPWIAASCLLIVAGSSVLWFAAPGAAAVVPLVLAGFVVATVGAEVAIVFTNAMMPSLAPKERLGFVSGFGWAMGYAGGLLALVLVLGFVVADAGTGRTLLGLVPVLPLDPAAHEGARFSGPFSALWLVIFAIPLFLLVPDKAPQVRLGAAVRQGLSDVRHGWTTVRAYPSAFRYLVAHMIYIDGLAALFAFGAVYATGVFGWSTIEVGVFGILLTISGTIGVLLGGSIEDRVGPKRMLTASLVVLSIVSALIVSTGPGHVLFVVALPDGAGTGLFSSPAEQIYVALGLVLGAMAGPLQSASRTYLVRLAPPDHLTSFFGLFALSGKVTSFLAPAAVAFVTAVSGSARLGISVVLCFLVVGLAVLLTVRETRP